MKLQTFLLAGIAVVVTAVLAVQAQVPGVNSTLNSVFTLAYDNSTMKPTYSATVSLTPAAAPTDVCSLSGSATKTIKVRRVIVAGTASAVMAENVSVLKRSTAYTAGAGSAMNKIAYDTSNAASTVNMAEAWTAAPTVGTLIGLLIDVPVSFANTTTGVQTPYLFDFGRLGQPIVLRGVAQQVAVNMEGDGGGAGTVFCTFEWTEE